MLEAILGHIGISMGCVEDAGGAPAGSSPASGVATACSLCVGGVPAGTPPTSVAGLRYYMAALLKSSGPNPGLTSLLSAAEQAAKLEATKPQSPDDILRAATGQHRWPQPG